MLTEYIKRTVLQKLAGIAMLIICAALVWMALNGSTPDERDITPVVLLAPLAIYLIFTRDKII